MHSEIVFQANCLFDLLEEMLRSIPPKKLCCGQRPKDVLARHALHILEVFEGYGRRGGKPNRCFGVSFGRFGKRFEPEDFPSKAAILSYLKRVKKQFSTYIESLPDDFFGKPKKVKNGRYQTNLGKYIYMLRHNTLHLAYMRRTMSDQGLPIPEFR